MYIYSFENLDISTDGFYNLNNKSMVNKSNLPYKEFIVTKEFIGRLDRVCKYIYGNDNFIEELMCFNSILNPLSIKEGDIIQYLESSSNYGILYQQDPAPDDRRDEILNMNNEKNTKKDVNRIGYPPTVKPDNLTQVDINYDKKKITILNKFK